MLKELSAIEFEVQYEPARSVDAKSISLDPSKMLNALNGFNWMPIRTGIAKTLASEGLELKPSALALAKAP